MILERKKKTFRREGTPYERAQRAEGGEMVLRGRSKIRLVASTGGDECHAAIMRKSHKKKSPQKED